MSRIRRYARTANLVGIIMLVSVAARAEPLDDALDAVQPEAGAEQDAAIIVAIEDYAHVPPISGARENARAWAQWFRRRGTPVVRTLSGAQARHQWTYNGRPKGILPAIEDVAAKVGSGGTLWFVFIGHGAPMNTAGQPQGGLLSQDVEQTPESIEARGIAIERDLLPRLAVAPRAVAVLDACFSGRDAAGAPLVPGMQPLLPIAPTRSKVTVLTAAGPDEYAGPLPTRARPAFSYLMLGALAGWADGELDRRRDQRVTASEAQAYVADQLARQITGRRQTPRVSGPDRFLARAWAESPATGGSVAEPTAGRQPGGASTVTPRPNPATPGRPVATYPPDGGAPVPSVAPPPAGRVAVFGETTVSNLWSGLRILHSVELKGMADREVEIGCAVRRAHGEPLADGDGRYGRDGVVSTRYRQPITADPMTIGAVFHDLPYPELHLPRGVHRLETRCSAFDGPHVIGSGAWVPFEVAP